MWECVDSNGEYLSAHPLSEQRKENPNCEDTGSVAFAMLLRIPLSCPSYAVHGDSAVIARFVQVFPPATRRAIIVIEHERTRGSDVRPCQESLLTH